MSQNRIAKLENLAGLPHLQTLNASKNFLTDAESVKELTLCLSLATVDLSHNNVDGEEILDTIADAPALVSINLVGNPVMNTPQFRKKAICKMPRLAYMDRPVFEAERMAAEAWGTGGREAELAAREQWRLDQQNKAKEERRAFRDWKAAKQEERRKQVAEARAAAVPAPEQKENAASGGGGGGGGGGHGEVNITKLAHKFWSAEATRSERTEPVPNAMGKYDVASFRAPSYVPDPIGYDDFEVKESSADEPPPLPDAEESVKVEPAATQDADPTSASAPPANVVVPSDEAPLPPPPPPGAVAASAAPLPPKVSVDDVAAALAESGITDANASADDSREDAIRKERVRESLAMYRKAKQTKAPSPTAEAPAPGPTGTEPMAFDARDGIPLARAWTEDMDMQLATLIRRDASTTFEACAEALNESGCAAGAPISALECDKRWSALTFGGSISSTGGGSMHAAPSDLNFALPGGDINDVPTFSRYLTKPSTLPSTNDDVDSNKEGASNGDGAALSQQARANDATTDFDELD